MKLIAPLPPDLDAVMRNPERVAQAVGAAQAEAARRHRLVGHPRPAWRDRHVVEERAGGASEPELGRR